MEICEYNPTLKTAATNPPRASDCKNPVLFAVGGGKWLLCKGCAKLPQFARMKKKQVYSE